MNASGCCWQIQANDQLEKAKDYEPLIIRYQDGAALRLSHVAKVKDSVEDRYNSGFFNNDAAVLLVVNRQAGANIIETVNAIKAQLPALQAVLPASVKLNLAMDRSPVIKATLHEAEMTLLIAVGLVILVVFLFLGFQNAMRIWLDPAKLNSYHLMPKDVVDAIAAARRQLGRKGRHGDQLRAAYFPRAQSHRSTGGGPFRLGNYC